MATKQKTAGKTAYAASSKRIDLRSLFGHSDFSTSNSESNWKEVNVPTLFSNEDLDCIVSCYVKGYSGKFGDYAKLYVTANIDGELLRLMDLPTESGERYSGIFLDAFSATIDPDEVCTVNPAKCIFRILRRKTTGDVILRVRVDETAIITRK